MRIVSAADMEKVSRSGLRKIRPEKPRIAVGLATCGIAVGGMRVYDRIKEVIGEENPDIELARVGCIGYCREEPLVNITIPGKPLVILHRVTPGDAEEIVRAVEKGEVPVEKALCRIPLWDHITGCTQEYGAGFDGIPRYEDVPFFSH